MTKTYRWANPHEWLIQKMRFMNPTDLYSTAVELAKQLDGDRIQELFQHDMDLDGYFEPIKEQKVRHE